MRKAQAQERADTAAPPSPRIPSKRAKVNPDEAALLYPSPTAPLFIRKMRNAAVSVGCDICLKVAVAGHPQPSLYWYHDDILLDTAGQEYGGLWIRDCRPSDAGLYTCIANNHLGEVRSSAVLAVLDLGEDSETTEDETPEAQVRTEARSGARGGARGPTIRAAQRVDEARQVPTETSTTRIPLTDGWGVGQDAVVEKEVPALCSRAPGVQDPSKASRQANDHSLREGLSQIRPTPIVPSPQTIQISLPTTSVPGPGSTGLTPSASLSPRKKAVVPSDYQDTVPEDFEEKMRRPKPSGTSQSSTQGSRPQTPVSECSRKDLSHRSSPKPAQVSSKLFEKVRFLEDRRRSIDHTEGEGSISGRSWGGFHRTPSVESDEGSRLGFSRESSKEDLREALKADAAERRSMFRQRAASLEDRARYSEKVQEIENKFTEELHRIKKLVGKSHMKKSFSTEHLSQRGRQPLRKLEPIPPQVLQKLQDRERIQQQQEEEQKRLDEEQLQLQQAQTKKSPVSSITVSRFGERPSFPKAEPVTMPQAQQPVEKIPAIEASQGSSAAETLQSSKGQEPVPLQVKEEPPRSSLAEQKNVSHFQAPPKPPRLTRPLSSGLYLRSQEEKMEMEVTPVSPEPRFPIPTIIVEEEPMEQENLEPSGQKRKGARGQRPRTKGHHPQPASPEPEDSYVCVGEDSSEPPMFEHPLQDTAAWAGSEVQLVCIVSGTPAPEVTWKKDDVEIKSSSTHVVKAAGEKHSLLIKRTEASDAGMYAVMAVNRAGTARCSAAVSIKPEPTQDQRGPPSTPAEISSYIASNEEYLSPPEEAMDVGAAPHPAPETRRTVDMQFREPPSFQVTLKDQMVTEGQQVTMSVRTRGQPKPIVYWLRDRVTIKTGGQHTLHETEDGGFEMKITSAQKSDAGIYTCKIVNEYGTKQCDCKLEVKAPAPSEEPGLTITRRLMDVTVRAGESAQFECQVRAPQDVDVDWLSDGKLVQPALLNCKMHFDGRTCRLLLNSVHEDDSGTYTCKLSTAREELTSCARLKVIPSTEPLFTRKLDVLEVIEGRMARFDCKVSGTPPPSVTWTHFDCTLKENDSIRILKEGGHHSLVILHASSEDEGLYTAVALNEHGKAETSAELYVQEPRPTISSQMARLEKMPSIPEEPEVLETEVEHFSMPDFVKPLYDLDVVEGKEAVLRCKVAGMPYPTITWFHNGRKIESTDDRKMTQYRDVHSLVIRSACHAHGGVYKSVISNKVGKATCYAHLYVTDVLPDPPNGPPVVEAITGKIIILRWNKPKKLDPSIDPTSLMYAVQQQIQGSIQWTIIASSLKSTSYTITSLSKGVRYFFRVLSMTNKAFSKPTPPTDALQLVDRGPYLQEAPLIIDRPDVVYMVENQPVSMTVTLNHVQATVTWKRQVVQSAAEATGDIVLANKPSVFEMSMPDDDQHTLQIFRAKTSDVGQLVCVACNQLGSDSCMLTLEMAAPPTFESIMEDVDVRVGETPRFAVVVEGKPVPDILWYKQQNISKWSLVQDSDTASFLVATALPGTRHLLTYSTLPCDPTADPEEEETIEDGESILRKMRRLTDYYDVHKEVGRGAFSYVKRVTQKADKAEYAAKFISGRAKRKASALREMKLLCQLEHERIVYFHDAFEKKNAVIIITELCHEELLDRLTKKSTVMESEIRSSMRQLLEGVGYLHQNNILHLDIKPENILMADPSSDQIRICDFGNAMELTAGEAQYCKYGTPEFVAPEIINQTPVSKATDIWPTGVITFLCLTGVSPFAGENDRDTALNVRNYNVAFEEGMFAGLCRETRGFVIKLLVADRLRPDTNECLRHPWFKTLTKGKSISTEPLKKFLSRRKWQRSLISYKSKMVMRSIPELLDDSSSHISIAVPKHLKEGSPPPSSSSDSDEDVDELPFIPMPLAMEFSGSRMSLNEIPTDDEIVARSNSTTEGVAPALHGVVPMECEPISKGMESRESMAQGHTQERATQEGDARPLGEETADAGKQTRGPLRKGSSTELEMEGGRRRGEMRRGSSADSALLLHITPEEGAMEEANEEGKKSLKKAVSMELPRRSPSPGAGRLSQEDYALKLELMRQRLLRGGSADNKMSGLRGPLLETLGIGDERRTSSLDRYKRPKRMATPPLTKAASSDTPEEEAARAKVLRKSASLNLGDSEPIPMHRRCGTPLEIPMTQREERKLQEATSMSCLTEQSKLESRPATPREISKPPTPVPEGPQEGVMYRKEAKMLEEGQKIIGEEEAQTVTQIGGVSDSVDESGPPERTQERSMLKGVLREDKKVAQGKPQSEVVPKVFKQEKTEDEEERKRKDEDKKDSLVNTKEEEKIPHRKSPEMDISTKTIMVTPVPTKAQTSALQTQTASSPPTQLTLPDGRKSAYASIMQTIMVPSLEPGKTASPISINEPTATPIANYTPIHAPTLVHTPFRPEPAPSGEHPAVFSKVASTDKPARSPVQPVTPPSPLPPQELALNPNIKDIASEEIFEAKFKKRESSLTRGLKLLTKSKTDETSPAVPDVPGEEVYRPGPIGAPLEFVKPNTPRLVERTMSVQDLREAEKDSSFLRRLSLRLKKAPSLDRQDKTNGKEPTVTEPPPRRRVSWSLGHNRLQDKKETEMMRLDGGSEAPRDQPGNRESKKSSESPVLAMRRKIESTVAGISLKIRSQSEERREENGEERGVKQESKRTPIFSRLRRSSSEGLNLKKGGVPQNQLAAQSGTGVSMESLESTSSMQSETNVKSSDGERRSRWDRWGLGGRSKKEKTASQPDIPSAIARGNGSLPRDQYSRLTSDFPPVFHIKLRDHILLEGDPVTLSCLPAGSPPPHIAWMKDKKPLLVDPRMNMISCPDGRQLLMIMKTTKTDAGLYACVASNPLGSVTSSCVISLARLPGCPGTPEVPQTYKDTALVLWKPPDTPAPCTYSLERRNEGEENWIIVATGVAECYCNVTNLPKEGTFRFRVACVNKAGQGPYSNVSEKVCLDSSGEHIRIFVRLDLQRREQNSDLFISRCFIVASKAPVKTTLSPVKSPAAVLPLKPSFPAVPSKSASDSISSPPAQISVPSPPRALPTRPTSTPTHAQSPSPAPATPVPPAAVSASTIQVAPDVQTAPAAAVAPAKAKSSLKITVSTPSSGAPLPARAAPPRVLPKLQSPVNIVSPMTQSPPTSPPPLVSPPPTLGKPISSVPTYVPVASTQATPASSAGLTPPVVLVTSLTPVGEGASTPCRMTPSGRGTPSGKPGETTLRQGVPQKPYTFLDEKNRGRFGVIRECRENATGFLFMAKIVPYEPVSKQAVLQEYDILKSLHHVNIMALHEAYVTPRYLVLICECCPGKELLYTLIDRFRYSEDDVVSYVVQILRGLEYLHGRRILHLDIKPDNIIVSSMNAVKIVDFGSAQTFNPLFLKPCSRHLGTLEFMPPEMVKGDVVGPPADIWSLGVLTYVMLSGRLPFHDPNPLETETKILAAKFDHTKLYPNVSQTASLFLKKIMCSYTWARPTIKDCFSNAWLQDAYLMKLRRQTLTFTTTRLKEFLVEHQRRRAEVVTKHKVLLRSYQSTPTTPTTPTTPVTQ
ncbi:striated muscle preferentially expressed protein kinase isoform X2 [Arapaima gigas]